MSATPPAVTASSTTPTVVLTLLLGRKHCTTLDSTLGNVLNYTLTVTITIALLKENYLVSKESYLMYSWPLNMKNTKRLPTRPDTCRHSAGRDKGEKIPQAWPKKR